MPSDLDQLLSAYSDPVRSWPNEDVWSRDMLLPFAKRETPQPTTTPRQWTNAGDVMREIDRQSGNQWQFAVPQIAKDVGDAVSTVGNAPLANPVRVPSRMTDDEITKMLDTAGAIVGPMAAAGFARAGLAAPGSELGIFGGRMAKTANHEKLALAEKMAAEGMPREQIWRRDLWWRRSFRRQRVW